MTKGIISVTVDTEIIAEARRRGINISEAAERGIAEVVNMSLPEKERKLSNVDKAEIALPAEEKQKLAILGDVDQNLRFARGWADKIKTMVGVKIEPDEVIQLQKRLKGGKV